jgi:signal transduction histidine kinase
VTRRHVPGLVGVSVIVLGLVTVHVSMLTGDGRHVLQAGMLDATLFGLLLYLWHWARDTDVRPSDLHRVGGWLALGTLVFGGGTLYQAWVAGGAGDLVVPGRTVTGFAVVGASAGLLIGINDVNRLVSARQERDQRARAEKLTEVLTVLNRVLRHDVRNDAHIIGGYADLAATDLSGSETALGDYLGRIQRTANDTVERSEQARDVERILFDDGDSLETVDLAERLDRRIERLRATHPDLAVAVEVESPTPVTAHGLVDSALDNVLENAIEHNDRESPRIEVRSRWIEHGGDSYVQVAVRDDGPGLPPTERRVLERGVETPLEHSTGLGLWIINWTVEASGGFVEIASRDPRGTEVRLHFRPATADAGTVERPMLAPSD